MGKYITTEGVESIPTWESLESFAREAVQKLLQWALEEEVSELLGRAPWERRSEDGGQGYRNGYGKARRLSMSSGTITLRRPRVRGLEERFESQILPLFTRRTQEIGELLPELYLHGLAQGDFDLALRGLLGEGAPLSSSSVARLKAIWQGEYEAWKGRSLSTVGVVYLWVDGIYVKAGLEKQKAAILVAIAGLTDGSKQIVALESGYRESIESWSSILRQLKQRGMNTPRLVIGDGHLGIWGALTNVYPEAGEQRCWNHRIVNILDKLPKKEQAGAKLLLTQIPYADTREEAETELPGVVREERIPRGGQSAREGLGEDGDFLWFPQGALEAAAYQQRGGVTLRSSASEDHGSKAVQEGAECYSRNLEDLDGG
jgi:transposase-like protein